MLSRQMQPQRMYGLLLSGKLIIKSKYCVPKISRKRKLIKKTQIISSAVQWKQIVTQCRS